MLIIGNIRYLDYMSNAETGTYAKTVLVVVAFACLSLIIVGGAIYATVGLDDATHGAWVSIAYMAGLSMIVLPCTMPLVFVIVPMSMGKTPRKGLGMAVLFGTGLVITITVYMIMASVFGDVASLDDASFIMFGIAGVIAYVFGLSQMRIISLRLPTYTGMPKFMQKRNDYGKSFLMGLLLGNAGVGCPNPMFYWLLVHVAATSSIELGTSLGIVHGVGRAIPLIFISILAILGVDATRRFVRGRARIEHITGITLVVLGAFLIINALPSGHEWYEQTFVHKGWNSIVQDFGIPQELVIGEHAHETVHALPIEFIPVILGGLVIAPAIAWIIIRAKKRQITPDNDV